MDRSQIIFWASEIFLFLFGIFILIVYPAIGSTTDNMNGILSSRASGYYSPSDDKIVILAENNTVDYFLAIRHELCHRNQKYADRLYSGNSKIFWNELECYARQWSGFKDYLQWRFPS